LAKDFGLGFADRCGVGVGLSGISLIGAGNRCAVKNKKTKVTQKLIAVRRLPIRASLNR
jgi:hypothetical protein